MYWLVLVLQAAVPGSQSPANGVAMLHVGNFVSEKECKEAATAADMTRKDSSKNNPPNFKPSIEYICVKANSDGIDPPK